MSISLDLPDFLFFIGIWSFRYVRRPEPRVYKERSTPGQGSNLEEKLSVYGLWLCRCFK